MYIFAFFCIFSNLFIIIFPTTKQIPEHKILLKVSPTFIVWLKLLKDVLKEVDITFDVIVRWVNLS